MAYPKLISISFWMMASFVRRLAWPEQRSTAVFQPFSIGKGWPIFELAGFLVDGWLRAVLHFGA